MPDVVELMRPGTLTLPALPPLSLYIHFPWCVRKCPYCDFNSHEPDAAGIPEAAYLDALAADIEAALPLIWGRPIVSVFIGGGTPSLLSAAGVERLLSDVRARLPLEADCEITMEANPGTFEAERFAAYRAGGVNRLVDRRAVVRRVQARGARPHPRPGTGAGARSRSCSAYSTTSTST